MIEHINDAQSYEEIVQVIGAAYTYRPSLAMRRRLAEATGAHHSSTHSDFSYFYKGDRNSLARHSQLLYLRRDPISGEIAGHWPEPELAILLGERHRIIAYTLANDLTAITIEARGRTENLDGTHVGKVWHRSGSLGPVFVRATAIEDVSKLVIGLKIIRRGNIIYDQRYEASRCIRPFSEIPDAVVAYSKKFGDSLPPSKKIMISPEGFLPQGTVVMLGTGLIMRRECFCEPEDSLTVYCSHIGELTNTIASINDSTSERTCA